MRLQQSSAAGRLHRLPLALATEARYVERTREGRVLCDGHNGALGPLDRFAAAFCTELLRVCAALSQPSDISTTVSFNGHNLERWLLKILCGMVASGNATHRGAPSLIRSCPRPGSLSLWARPTSLPRLGSTSQVM